MRMPINTQTLYDPNYGGMSYPGSQPPPVNMAGVPKPQGAPLRTYATPRTGILGRDAQGNPIAYGGSEMGNVAAMTRPQLETAYHAGQQTPGYDISRFKPQFAFQDVKPGEVPKAVAEAAPGTPAATPAATPEAKQPGFMAQLGQILASLFGFGPQAGGGTTPKTAAFDARKFGEDLSNLLQQKNAEIGTCHKHGFTRHKKA